MKADQLLPDMLALAVPLWIEELRDRSHIHRRARAQYCAQVLGYEGDTILYHSNRKTAYAFNRLAEAVAIGSLQPGGIRAFGIHWCAAHHPAGVEQKSQICEACLDDEEAA